MIITGPQPHKAAGIHWVQIKVSFWWLVVHPFSEEEVLCPPLKEATRFWGYLDWLRQLRQNHIHGVEDLGPVW